MNDQGSGHVGIVGAGKRPDTPSASQDHVMGLERTAGVAR